MEFIARLYNINKGKNAQSSYFATIKKAEAEKYNLKNSNAFILKIDQNQFPTKVRKLRTGSGSFQLGFTVPSNIGKNLTTKCNHRFIIVKENLKQLCSDKVTDGINLFNIIPSKTIRNFPIITFEDKYNLLIWIYSKGNKLTSLPKEIKFNVEKYNLFELVGAFFCEGFKSRKPKRHRDRFSFSNADKAQIKWFLEAAEHLLKIRKEEWFAQVLYPNDDFSSVNHIKNYWSSVGLKRSKINVVKNEKTNAESGVCILNIYNSSLAESFYYIAAECQKLSLKSKTNAIQFFRGLSRGDLGVGNMKNHTITFSTESEENALFFVKLCKVISISTNKPLNDKRGVKGYWIISINHYNNFRKLVKYNCVTHHRRKKNLYKGIINSKKSNYFNYLIAVNNGYNTSRKLRNNLGIAESTSLAVLLKYFSLGYLSRKNNGCYVYKLTKKGKDELKFYNKLKNI
jgi:hypothetical protein